MASSNEENGFISSQPVSAGGAEPAGLNLANIKRVRDVIAALPPEKFDMSSVYLKGGQSTWPGDAYLKSPKTVGRLLEGCGTAACIAGWTIAAHHPGARTRWGTDIAAGLLGLDAVAAGQLFMPPNFQDSDRYTIPMAVRVLDHLMATGEVDWFVAGEAAQ